MLLDTLMVKITGDSSGLSTATRTAQQDVSGMGSSFDGTGGKFSTFFNSIKASAFGNIIADMASTAMSALAGLASEAVEASDSTQKFQQTLTFAGVDSSTIDQLTASTQEYANQTVYGLADIRNITSQLASNGVPNYEKLAEAAGNLNAVAGGTAETYKSVGMVLTQTAGQGKLTTENWNQLSDAIPGASGKLQQAMLENGAYTGNFRDAMAAGQITADEFNQALLQLGMSDVAVDAAKSTSTFEGAFGNLQAACVTLMSQGLDLIKPAATGAINGLTSAISAIPDSIGKIGGVINDIKSDVADFQTETGNVATAGDIVRTTMQTIGQAVGLSYEQINPLATSLAGLFDQVQSSVAEIGSNAEPYIQPLIDTVMSLVSTLQANLLPMISSWYQMMIQIYSTVVSVLTPVLDTIVPIVLQIVTMVIGYMQQAAAVIMPAMTNIFNTITQIISAITPYITAAMTAIMAVVQNVWPYIQVVITGVMNAVMAVITTVMGVIQGVLDVVLSAINGDWDGVWNGMQEIVTAVWNGILGVISGALQAVSGIISGGLELISSLFNSIFSGIYDFMFGIFGGIKDFIGSTLNEIPGFFAALPGNILNALGDLGSILYNAGESIIDGFFRGISDAVGSVYDFVSGIAGHIAELKGPIPYDLKLLIPNGKAIMSGLLSGIDTGVQGVFDRVSTIGSEISDSLINQQYTLPITPSLNVGQYGAMFATSAGTTSAVGSQTTNIYIDGAIVNDNPQIARVLRDTLLEYKRKGDM